MGRVAGSLVLIALLALTGCSTNTPEDVPLPEVPRLWNVEKIEVVDENGISYWDILTGCWQGVRYTIRPDAVSTMADNRCIGDGQ